MTDNHALIAFIAILLTIVFLSWMKVDQAVLFGLVGVIGTFKPATKPQTNVEQAETVNTGDKT